MAKQKDNTKIKLVILDVDGVLTDGKKYYRRDGSVELKTFCDKDWTAIKRFKSIGIQVLFLTGDPFNEAIAKNRNIDCIVNRKDGYHKDKADYLPEICEKYKVTLNEIVFVGDDIFDIGIMKKVAYKYCPCDAPEEIRDVVDDILQEAGGNNCVMLLWDVLKQEKLIPEYDMDKHLNDVYNLDIKEKF